MTPAAGRLLDSLPLDRIVSAMSAFGTTTTITTTRTPRRGV